MAFRPCWLRLRNPDRATLGYGRISLREPKLSETLSSSSRTGQLSVGRIRFDDVMETRACAERIRPTTKLSFQA